MNKNKKKDGRKELQRQVMKYWIGFQLFLHISQLHSFLHLKTKNKTKG